MCPMIITPCLTSLRTQTSRGIALAVLSLVPLTGHMQQERDDIFVLDPFTVDATGDRGYFASNAVSGTRVNMLIQDLPQNLLVITEDLLRDVAATTLFEALEYAGGIVQGGERDTPNSVIVRGFSTDWPLRNGIKRVGAVADAANISRLEVIKGPAAILYGQSGLGGVVNYITKTPMAGETFGSLDFAVGSYNHYRLEADLNLPLGDGQKWLTRWIGAVQSSESFIRNFRNDTYFFAPSVEWRPFDGLSIRLDGEYFLQNQTSPVSALPRYNHPDRVNQATSYFRVAGLDGLVPVSHDYNLNGEGTFRDIEIPTISLDLRWTPQRGLGPFDRFSYRSVVYRHVAEREQLAALVGAVDRVHRIAPALLPTSRLFFGQEIFFRDTAIWSPVYREAKNEVTTLQNEISLGKDFEKWSVQFLIGQEYFRDERTDRRRTIGGNVGDPASDWSVILRVPIFAPTLDGASFPTEFVTGPRAADFQQAFPDYPLTPEAFNSPVFDMSLYNVLGFNEEVNVVKAYYVSSQWEFFNRRLIMMGGLRYDNFLNRNRQSERRAPGNAAARAEHDFDDPMLPENFTRVDIDKVSPQIGASLRIRDGLNVYAMYSEGVFPNNNVNLRPGDELKPQTSEGVDIGLKYQLWDGRINGAMAVFQIDRSGVPRPFTDPDTGISYTELGGLHRSRGYEIDFVMAPVSQIQLFGGYTYLDAKYVEDTDPRNNGTRLAYVPTHRFSLLSKYLFEEGPLEGGFFGVGFVYQSDTRGVDTPGETNVNFTIPGFVKWDLIAGYETQLFGRNFSVSARLDNLFDKTYVPNRLQGYGRPRSLIVRMRMDF